MVNLKKKNNNNYLYLFAKFVASLSSEKQFYSCINISFNINLRTINKLHS